MTHRFAESTDQEVLQATVSRQETQFALALMYGFNDWKALKERVEEMATLILNREQVGAIEAQALTDGMTTHMQEGIEKIFGGHSDLRQVRRAVASFHPEMAYFANLCVNRRGSLCPARRDHVSA